MESNVSISHEPKLVDARQFAALLDVDTATIYKRAHAAKIPSPNKIDGKMQWNIAGLDLKAVRIAVTEASVVRAPKSIAVKQVAKAINLPVREVAGPKHKCYPELLYRMSQRQSVYIYGPMGSGKSHAAEQAAAALGLTYAYTSLNPQSPASLLMGFIDAQGRYVETDFYRAYKNGGAFCLDEYDNGSSSLYTSLNSALANGHCSFPCGMIERHPDFVLIATGNTTGRGGDWQYPERRKIDESCLDRLKFIAWDYDVQLENSIVSRLSDATQITAPWVAFVRKVREYVNRRENGIKGGVYATPRAIFTGCDDLVNSPLSVENIADANVFKGLDKDTRVRILNACPLPTIQRSQSAAA